jgi:hypothetical protein
MYGAHMSASTSGSSQVSRTIETEVQTLTLVLQMHWQAAAQCAGISAE